MTLRQLREFAKLTQEQVAERAGLRQGAISNLEGGRIPNPTIGTIEDYARGLGQPVETVIVALRETVAQEIA